ncbi:BAG family molecular chaperone regulator 5, mitochondrial [Cinnamomum micranthum f. kanehirae]|uniref:BAG family molecular chaperone regulator 5, mitochondrial n=1 Tax=Cinnamomum micranthum f. kanehirae TaxID=337451 RepID=A0A3S3MV77_9MAGN|nr:BAG family molecular chaperone regulator 5, mitochondrial [Cinnamomum micranthum f. kanehirae]
MGKKSSIIKARFFSYSSVLFTNANDEITPLPHTKTTSITIESPTPEKPNPTPIPVILPESVRSAAAVKIQSAYRSHMVRKLVIEISAVNSEAGRYEELIRRQETVDAVRSDDRERLRVSEGLMSLLLRLDGVRGIDLAVRELRRSVSRRIVALQEVVDAVAEAKLEVVDGFPMSWEEIVRGDCGGGGGRRRECENGFECFERVLWRLSL